MTKCPTADGLGQGRSKKTHFQHDSSPSREHAWQKHEPHFPGAYKEAVGLLTPAHRAAYLCFAVGAKLAVVCFQRSPVRSRHCPATVELASRQVSPVAWLESTMCALDGGALSLAGPDTQMSGHTPSSMEEP